MASMALIFITVLALPCTPNAMTKTNEFLRTLPEHGVERINEDSIRSSLLKEIEDALPDALGNSNPSSRFVQIDALIRPMYTALPKNVYGNLEHSVARYALHRLFMLRHGWAIKGLGPSSGKYNATSPAGVLQDQVPSFVEELFELRLGGKGFNLHDLAVLAATIEHLVQEESIQRLSAASKIYNQPDAGASSSDEESYSMVQDVLDTYMAGFILSEDLVDMSEETAMKKLHEITEMFAHWRETQRFVHNVWKNATERLHLTDPFASAVDFAALTTVVEDVGDQFGGFFHDTVCGTLKDKLMSLEYQNTGRIKLSEFYKPVFDGFWQFQESVGYLRELGVLEETDPKEPSVLIANYMNAPTNCIAYSGFYSACCKNECEGLLRHIEDRVSAPVAQPEAIAAFFADLASPTVPAPRILSATSLRRLDEIAVSHGGQVPLHGRLFAQWMHHEYPRECAYPHISGTTSPKLPEEWLTTSGTDSMASEEEMLQYIKWARNASTSGDVLTEDLLWSLEEELLVVRPMGAELQWSAAASSEKPVAKRSMVLLTIAGSLSYALVQALKATMSDFQEVPQKFSI
jgi:hypothetical protein